MTAPAAKTILVVDDDADVRDALMSALAENGYAVVGASNGREAIELLAREARPSLILLDLMMPVMNGWQFRAAQRSDPALAPIPVLVISADANLQQKADTLDAAGWLKKPLDLETLLAAAARVCGG